LTSGVKVIGTESWIGKEGQNLLGWKGGYSHTDFENSSRTGQFAKNREIFRVDTSGCAA